MLAIKYSIKDLGAKKAVDDLAERMTNPRKALKECGLVLIRSVAKNFKAGGRPAKWKASKRAKATGGKTLIDTARLKNSITMKVYGKKLTVGTNVKYAGIQHYGGKINETASVKNHYRVITKAFGKTISGRRVLVRAHSRKMNVNIPARPYLLIQAADRKIINRIFGDYLVKGKIKE